MKTKRIRDPLYGYIKVEEIYIPMIDCPEFQRLRHIKQTGYQALFPSAEHTRFTHSLGVFHLGKWAIDCFRQNIDLKMFDIDEKQWNVFRETFILACLLHDVGHSPFSHTGESYYDKGIVFEEELPKCMSLNKKDKERFVAEIKTQGTGKSHESMSAIIGIELCKMHHFAIDEDLFVRSIIGVQYQSQEKSKKGQKPHLSSVDVLKNAIIMLLNGNLIDVDKLDYVMRDAFITGFNTLQIDMDRLLSNYTIAKGANGELTVAYKKGAISVIENVIYANDLERRWVQTHPVILYDCNLTGFAIREFDTMAKGRYAPKSEKDPLKGASTLATVFTKEALSVEGIGSGEECLKLLCDDDIICYVKNRNNKIATQLFARDARCKPMWKTEIEFEDLTSKTLGTDVLAKFQGDLQATLDVIEAHTQFFINSETVSRITETKARAEDVFKKGGLNPEDLNISLSTYHLALQMCNFFEDFKATYSLQDFEFAAITVQQKFQSAYKKLEAEGIKIELEPNKVVPLSATIPVKSKDYVGLSATPNLFYIYTTKANLEAIPDIAAKFFEHIRRKYPYNSYYDKFQVCGDPQA